MTEFETVWQEATKAGVAAGTAHTPEPMIVQRREDPFDDTSKVEQQWFVPQGVCGFGWVNVSPGNSKFANWMKKNGHAKKAYGGGVNVWISRYGQSYEQKMAHAGAMAKVLREHGIKAYADGRLD